MNAIDGFGAGRMVLELQRWPYNRPFVISRGTLVSQTVLYAHAHTPWGMVHGEGEPHESDDRVARQALRRGRAEIAGWHTWPTRDELRRKLPPDGLRNCLDALLWDLECKRQGLRAWEVAGLSGVTARTRLPTMVTVSLDTPDAMAAQALRWPTARLIKLKLGDRGGDGLDRDIERAEAVARAAPQAELVVDANEGWSLQSLKRFVEATRRLDLCLIEQPLPAGRDSVLKDWSSPVPLAADESCTALASLNGLGDRYQYVNLKLDKCGGLTEGLDMVKAARQMGMGLMVGCNCGTSLAMACAFILATQCDLVDLDGPLHLQQDRTPSIAYCDQQLGAPEASLWG